MIKALIKMLNGLSSNTDPGAIAHGFACGMILGFIPKDNLLWYILFFVLFFLRIQRGMFTLALLIGSLVAPLIDPAFDKIGWALLTTGSLQGFYSFLFDIPFVAFTKLNNTIVLGSFVFSLVVYTGLYFLMRLFIREWRLYLAEKIRSSRIVKATKQIPLIQKIAELMDIYAG